MLNSTIRKKRLEKINPFNGYNFKCKPSGNVFNARRNSVKTIYLPEHDRPTYHNILTNMRNSVNYVKDPNHFDDRFMRHLDKTGFEEKGLICRREYVKEEGKRRRKFGSQEDMVIRYPFNRVDDVIRDIERSYSKETGDGVDEEGSFFESMDNFNKHQSQILEVDASDRGARDVEQEQRESERARLVR